MLPHNRLGAKLRRHLKVYVGPEHPHQSQVKAVPGQVEAGHRDAEGEGRAGRRAACCRPPRKPAAPEAEQPDQTESSEEETST